MLEDRLQASDYGTIIASDGVQALEKVEQEAPHLMLLDLDMPRLGGLDVLKRLPTVKQAEDIPVIVMTAHGSIEAAVEAMKSGAYDFLTKPLDKDHLLLVIGKALERDSLKRQVACLKSEVDSRYASIIGTSAKIRTVLESAQRAAKSDAGVLLLGESGTGKELLARSIHQWSPRHAMPLVVINCVALTETLLENALFGHERGAFTGADRLQKGKLEMAEGGTAFLDELRDMSLPLQAKLLRERLEDFPALAKFFLSRHAKEAKRPGMWFSPAAMEALARYSWPGNIRELDNVIARAVILSQADMIEPEVLALDFTSPDGNGDALSYLRLPYHESMEAHSRHIIDRALRDADGNQTKAAERLKLQRTYLARLLRQQRQKLEEKDEADDRVIGSASKA